MARSRSKRVALCGVICALSVVLMLSGSIIPCATFCAPALAGAMLMVVAMECGMHLAWMCYGAISVLSVLLVPDKELALFFVFLFGHYPLLKAHLQRMHCKPLAWLCKAAVFNLAVVAVYGLLLFVLPMPGLVEEFAQTQSWLLAVLLALGNLCFFVYDAALLSVLQMYVLRIKPRIRHLL